MPLSRQLRIDVAPAATLHCCTRHTNPDRFHPLDLPERLVLPLKAHRPLDGGW
jgi:hypothetical protein